MERYGWFIVLGLVILAFLWVKLKPYWRELQRKWERQREIANFGKQAKVSAWPLIQKLKSVLDPYKFTLSATLFSSQFDVNVNGYYRQL